MQLITRSLLYNRVNREKQEMILLLFSQGNEQKSAEGFVHQ